MFMSLYVCMHGYLPNAVEGVVVSVLCVHMRADLPNAKSKQELWLVFS